MRLCRPLLLLAAAVLPADGLAQAPTLVKDIYPGVATTASAPATFESVLGAAGGKVFLTGWGADGDDGVWVTDGSAAGTRIVLDLPGLARGADLNGTLFFAAVAQDGRALWKSDGTVAGTSLVSRFNADPSAYTTLRNLTKAGDRLFFTVDDGVHGEELWTSDGSAFGTRLVKDLTPGPAGSFDHSASFTGLGGVVLFSCGSLWPCGLWRSDGTEAGTFRLADVEMRGAGIDVGGTAFFAGTDAAHGMELWKSDGTSAGTVLVRDIVPGAGSSYPSSLVPFGGGLCFHIQSDESTWKSDGTEAGTVEIPGFPSTYPIVPAGGRLFAASGSQLWASDGTAAGTQVAHDFGTPLSLYPSAAIPGGLLLWIDRGADGLELWRSDGTAAGTTPVKVVEAGNESASPGGGVSVSGLAVFTVVNGSTSLWRSDGTPAGTWAVQASVFRPNDGLPVWLTDVNGTLLFWATDAEHGTELWRSDGTPAGTVLVKDIAAGPSSSQPGFLMTAGSSVFFSECLDATGCELYRTDGTESGTGVVTNLNPGAGGGSVSMLGVLRDLCLFAAEDVNGMGLWRSDGTPDGTFALADATNGLSSNNVFPLGELNGAFYFSAGSDSATLWKTDGTAAGTVAVGSMPNWNGGSAILGDVAVFAAYDAAHGIELWKTDGTAVGTALLRDINPSGDSSPYFAGRVGDRVFFWADDGVHGMEPWVTDGTAAGTSLLKDINPGAARSIGVRWAIVGSTIYFWAHDGVRGFELWKSDGTAAGTALVRDIAPGPAGSMFIERFAAAGHEIFFTASDHASGRELWRSDGTEAGTSLVADLAPGLAAGATSFWASLNRNVLARSGGRIFFTASDGTTGHELWSLPIPLGFHPVTPCRVADTRDSGGVAGGIPLANAQTLILPVAGRCGIPSTAISVAANVTVVNPTATGSLSVFAGGPIVSGTTEVPVTAGKTRALNAIPILGTAGSLAVRAGLPEGGSTHVVLDVSGYFE